jgi:hypothetical protein
VLKVSIIVPAEGSQDDLDNTLVAILENRPEACEVIVAHPATYHDPYDLADEVTFIRCDSDDIASLINAGIQASRASIVHTLLSGVRATEGWTRQPLALLLSDPAVAAVSPLIVDPQKPTRVVSAGLGYRRSGAKRVIGAGTTVGQRSRTFRIDGPTLQASFFRREVFLQLGGCRAAFGRYHIDTDWTARLKSAGKTCLHAAESRLLAQPVLPPRGFRAGRDAERLYWDDARQHGLARSIVQHAGHVTWSTLAQLPSPTACTSLLGRAWGWMQSLRAIPPAEMPCEAAPSQDAPMTLPIRSVTRPTPASNCDARPAARKSA